MNKCKITVLKTTFERELAEEYGGAGLGVCCHREGDPASGFYIPENSEGHCPVHKEGEVFYADYRMPEGFCNEAWKAFSHYVFALAHDSGRNDGLFFTGRWIRKPGVAICTCNDGLRPVFFKIEQTDEKVLP